MNKKLIIIIGLQTLLIVCLFWVLVFYGKDEYESFSTQLEEEIPTASHVQTQDSASVINISTAMQQQSDIETTVLNSTSFTPVLNGYAQVIPVDTLVDLHAKLVSANADEKLAKIALANSKQEYDRMLALNNDDHNVSDKLLLAAETQFKADTSKLDAIHVSINNLSNQTQEEWGLALAKLASTSNTKGLLDKLIQHQEYLVRVTLPFDAKAPSSLYLRPIATETAWQAATLISEAPQSENFQQGKTYFYSVPASNTRIGMKLAVSYKVGNDKQTATIVPNSAIVWYSGKPWAYLKISATEFKRIAIDAEQQTNDGWLSLGSLKVADEVVTKGAQLLLSEEFKFQIKNENDD